VAESRAECRAAWAELRKTPVFGCICTQYGNAEDAEDCDNLFDLIHRNPCIGEIVLVVSPHWFFVANRSDSFWQCCLSSFALFAGTARFSLQMLTFSCLASTLRWSVAISGSNS